MTEPISIKGKPLDDLKKYFIRQIIAIPELQRNFVWNIIRARDLADSIYKGYPIGTFTIWNAPKRYENLLKHAKGLLPPYDSKLNNTIHYVIDGQQRLIVLYGILTPTGVEITNDRGQTFNSFNICFTIEKDYNGLNFIYSKKGDDNKRTFSICRILDDSFEKNILPKISSVSTRKKLKECRSRFINYNFGFAFIETGIKETNLKETFIRLNTRGLSLSSVDRAYAYASNVRLREYVKKIKDKLGESFKNISDKPVHEAIFLIYGGKRFNSIAIDNVIKKINNNAQQKLEFEKRKWKEIAHAIEDSINFLKTQGVLSSGYLPSHTMIPILANYFYHKKSKSLRKNTKKALIQWFWYSAISGRYSGRGYTRNITKDAEVMRELANGKKKNFEKFRKIPFSDIDNALYYNTKSSLVRAFYCLLALQNPREFSDYLIRIDLTDPTYRSRKQNHHIFPQNLIERIIPAKRVNSIVNICFLPQGYNVSFNNDPPKKYLKSDFVDSRNLEKILRSHLIPAFVKRHDNNIKNSFNKFYSQRRLIIIEKFRTASHGLTIFE